ncbi:MAG: SARP family transcriptional regulator, partial [Halanaerobium sp. MSAO_Bac5]
MSSGELCFYGLGSFYLEYGGKRVDGNNWISKRAMYLLMYLALEWKRKVSVEELIDIFWPESEIEDGKTKLYNTIYLLRRSLAKDGVPKDIIESVTGCYTINKNYKIWTDWEYFEKEIDKQLKADEFEIEILKDLFILYRGDFFSNLKYEDWVDIYREELREYYLNL